MYIVKRPIDKISCIQVSQITKFMFGPEYLLLLMNENYKTLFLDFHILCLTKIKMIRFYGF